MAEILKTNRVSYNIAKSLEEFAEEHFIPISECEFEILKTNTYISSSATAEFQLYSPNILKEFIDKERILNEHIEFKQQYQITLSQMQECKIKLNYIIALGDYAITPKIILFPDSIIPHELYTPKELLKLLYTEFNKIKTLHGLLIRIFDDTMISNLKALVKYIYMGKFTKKVKITLYDGIDPVITRKGKVIYWFSEKEKKEKIQVTEVDADELLIEYKKPIFGKGGFDAYGRIISAEYVTHENDLEVTIDEESIYIKEDANAKQYIAKKQGYVHFNQNYLCVNNKINFHNISRNAHSVASQEENSIEVTVSQYDTNRDSIGEGVELKSETIHVDGFVGAKSILKAVRLSVDGATHQESKQFAKLAQINRHKGKLRCQHAKIALLEGGEVHATTVEIESSLGGSIYAQDVTIGHVKSNLKVYASNSIKVKLVSGEDNLLHIGYKAIPILQSKINFINKDIEDLKYHLEEAARHKPENIQKIKENIQILKEEHYSIVHSYENATITVEKPFHGLNTITFTIDGENEITYKTDEKEYSPFYLEINENKITLHPVEKSIKIEE